MCGQAVGHTGGWAEDAHKLTREGVITISYIVYTFYVLSLNALESLFFRDCAHCLKILIVHVMSDTCGKLYLSDV